MSYERLIETIRAECANKGISCYRLSQISTVPTSTIYGIFHHRNKAQIDTLCILLGALGLQLRITSKESREEAYERPLEDWVREIQELPYEKRDLIRRMVWYLKE